MRFQLLRRFFALGLIKFALGLIKNIEESMIKGMANDDPGPFSGGAPGLSSPSCRGDEAASPAVIVD